MASHPVDIYVGNKLRARRIMLGMSQEATGKLIGVSFQQIQKYEKGINRIGSSRLFEFSQILNVPISYFFEGYEYSNDNDNSPAAMQVAEEAENFEHEKITSRETLELVRSYYSIKDDKVRKKVADLVKAMAAQENNKNG